MSKTAEVTAQIARQIAKKLGVQLVDVEYIKTPYGMELCIYIDKDGGITLDDTTDFSKAIGDLLDEVDVTNGAAYTLNVSSPGLDRKLKTKDDYVAAVGKKVEIKLFAPQGGKKEWVGTLTQADDSAIILDQTQKIDRTKIASANLYIDFNAILKEKNKNDK